MKFNYIKLKNFLSYGEDITTVKLSGTGITFVSGENKRDGGSNGSGKSAAVVDSIVYALFGKTTKKLKAEDVVNNINKKDCFVELSFNIRDDEYIIRRYRAHKDFGNELIIDKNGMSINIEDGKSNTQKLIESIIKISYKSFVLSIVLSQEKVANFAEVEKLERKQIIENLLMYDFISKYHKASKEIIRKIRPQIEKLTSQYSDKREVIKTLTNNLLKYAENLDRQSEERQERIEKLKASVRKWKGLNLSEEVKSRNVLSKREEELIELEEKTISNKEELSDIKKRSSKLEKEAEDKKGELGEYLNSPELCPTCGGTIKNSKFNKFISEKEEYIKRISEEAEQLVEKKTELGKRLNRRKKRIDTKNIEISDLKEYINKDLTEEDIKNFEKKINDSESEIKFLSAQEEEGVDDDPYISESEAKIDDIKLQSKSIKRKIRKLELELNHFNWWKDALSNSPNSIKSFCINHILTSLNKYINYYISFFKYDMTYTLDDDLSDHIIKDGEEVTFGHLSRGEKRSVEISLMFALYEIIRHKMPDNINLIVLDELLSNFLDDIRIGGALNILQELESRGFDVFIIEHKEIIKESLMCNTINVSKDKRGFSTLESES